MRSFVTASLVAAFLGLGITAAAAQPSMPQPNGMQTSSDNVLQVDYRKYKKRQHMRRERMRHQRWKYDRRYGPRYRHKRAGYGYYRDGWWYQRRYWDEPGLNIHLGL